MADSASITRRAAIKGLGIAAAVPATTAVALAETPAQRIERYASEIQKVLQAMYPGMDAQVRVSMPAGGLPFVLINSVTRAAS